MPKTSSFEAPSAISEKKYESLVRRLRVAYMFYANRFLSSISIAHFHNEQTVYFLD